jgi:hypothetical protein
MTFWLVRQSQVPRDEILAKTSGYMGHIKEATEIKLPPDSINREAGIILRKAWPPSTSLL